MNKYVGNLIPISGLDIVDDACLNDSLKSFKETNIALDFCIPAQKPDIEQIVRMDVQKKIYKTQLIESPRGISYEGQIMTGYKLLVMGALELKIVYVANDLEQTMHTCHAYIPICEYVTLPPKKCSSSATCVYIYIEDVFLEPTDCRNMFVNINILIAVEA